MATLGVEKIHDAGDIIVHTEGKKLIYHLINATITANGHIPVAVNLRSNVYTLGKGYVNGQDIPIMLAIGTIGNIYAMDISGNPIYAQYVSGTIIAFHI